jgi:type III restriction enzyme
MGKRAKGILDHLQNANYDANPELLRASLKLATGAGKTTVMAMLIAWQTVNAVRHPQSKHFTRGFLVVTPGLTIKDRLRVLQPNDPDNYYVKAELVPPDLLDEIQKAKIVITNYHAFMLRQRVDLSSGGRRLLQGRGEPLDTLETEGQMIQRVMPDLMGMKNILVLNDEAHHCYREKPIAEDDEDLKGDELATAKKNKEAARRNRPSETPSRVRRPRAGGTRRGRLGTELHTRRETTSRPPWGAQTRPRTKSG